jgi:hypothetical protein
LDSEDLAAQAESNLRFRISGFEILESSNFKILIQSFVIKTLSAVLRVQPSGPQVEILPAR